jgi:hypothetical protein
MYSSFRTDVNDAEQTMKLTCNELYEKRKKY